LENIKFRKTQKTPRNDRNKNTGSIKIRKRRKKLQEMTVIKNLLNIKSWEKNCHTPKDFSFEKLTTGHN
jgi:hypothetical protein